MTREAFEAWISAPPYEQSVELQDETGTWPGQYRRYKTQLAWEAWQESARQEREACAKVCEAFGASPDGSSEGYEGACAAAIRARSAQ